MAINPCRECKTDVSSTAKACPKCGAPVVQPIRWGRIIAGGLGISIVLAVMVTSNRPTARDSGTAAQPSSASADVEVAYEPPIFGDTLSAATSDEPEDDPAAQVAKNLIGEPPTGATDLLTADMSWSYADEGDAMDDVKTKIACTTSLNQVNLSWPYKAVTAKLCIRKSPKFGLDAFVVLDGKGQILCRSDSCSVRVRFDSNTAKSFSGLGASDNSSNIVFVKNVPRLVSGLRESSKTAIELEFYQDGEQVLEFRTAGLVWP